MGRETFGQGKFLVDEPIVSSSNRQDKYKYGLQERLSVDSNILTNIDQLMIQQ